MNYGQVMKDSVCKLIVQGPFFCDNNINFDAADSNSYKQMVQVEHAKFIDADELCKIDSCLEVAQRTTIVKFNNWVEDWENIIISTKNEICRGKLMLKYKNIFIYDPDADMDDNSKVRRVVDIEWKGYKKSETRRGSSSNFVCVTDYMCSTKWP